VKPFRKRLVESGVLVCDGAMGTMIMSLGFDSLRCPEVLNLEQAGALEEIAAAYIDAGADVVSTNTFGASPLKLAATGLQREVERINRVAVEAARRAADSKGGRYVAGSCGPTGKILKPYGDIEPEEMRAGFVTQMGALIEGAGGADGSSGAGGANGAGGVDAVFIETMTDLDEALLAVGAAREISPTIPVAVTMTFDPTPRGFFTMMGVSVEKAVASLEEAGVDILGTNCGNGMDAMIRIASEYRSLSERPLLVHANAGLPEVDDHGKVCYPETPGFFGRKGEELVRAGARLIGGCCGTAPDHIRALREVADNAEKHVATE